MIRLTIELPTISYREQNAEDIKKMFDGFDCSWQIEGIGAISFDREIISTKERENSFEEEINQLTKLMTLNPDQDEYKRDYEYYVNRRDNEWRYLTNLVMSCHLPFHFSANKNFFYLDSDINRINSFDWYEFYTYELKKLYMAIVLSIVISHPEISIACAPIKTYIDDQMYRKELHMVFPWHNDAHRKYPSLFTTSISLQNTFDWIKKHTTLFTPNTDPVIAVATLSYLLNRDLHENLIYSIIGLESLHVPEEKGVSNLLPKRLCVLFPQISKAEIKTMYKMRSKFVHGEMNMEVYPILEEGFSKEGKEIEEVSLLATALLIESLRILVKSNAKGFHYQEQISYSFEM